MTCYAVFLKLGSLDSWGFVKVHNFPVTDFYFGVLLFKVLIEIYASSLG